MYVDYPTVLILNIRPCKPGTHDSKAVKNIFIEESMPQATFYLGLALTGFRTISP